MKLKIYYLQHFKPKKIDLNLLKTFSSYISNMNSEIDRFNLPDKIIDLLTINHDQFFTIRELHSALYEKFDEFRRLDLKKDLISRLKVTFLTIEGEYNNIYRVVKDDKHYLIWSLKTKEEVMKEIGGKTTNPVNISSDKDPELEKDLDNFLSVSSEKDYVALIKQFINDKNMSFMYDENFMDGINHPIHILIKNNEYDLIKKLYNIATIDFTILNKDRKSCIDIAKEVNNFNILEFIYEKYYETKISNLTKVNDNLKESQRKAYEQITELTKQVTAMKEEIKILKVDGYIETIKSIAIVVLFFMCFAK